MVVRFTQRQRLILFSVSIISGSLSFISSLTIICMILRSRKKLTIPYRRLVFGLSVYDMIYSTAHIIAWPTLPSSEKVWGAIGTQQTCEVQGFMLFVGMSGASQYNLSLCIFYVCQIVLSMKASVFEKKIEPFLHAITTLSSFVRASYILAKGYFNVGPEYLMCWISPYPALCTSIDKIKCLRGESAELMRKLLNGIPMIIIFCLITVMMSAICWKVFRQELKVQKYRFFMRRSIQKFECIEPETEGNASGSFKIPEFTFQKKDRYCQSLKLLRRSKKAKAALSQASCYVLAFLITWIIPFVNSFILIPSLENEIRFGIRFVSNILNPAQGLINMFVYTRTSIIALRHKFPQYSWSKAFIMVVKSGGDNDGRLERTRSQIMN